ncbi:VWA domain-containing protein [Thiospirochaeta perfilievii]|uniref:VWA domain-containing protein n=1 Tax=Thiospirochaeta perfilievii TaxID=252967 RepID=A0A5C1QBV6_9SPIO|nr:VWA domain-containing protein [Thiospirochaeta perfilievii]QEN05011.1 VWA domain-containing protein [Thiospirochaeta perfilievii]
MRITNPELLWYYIILIPIFIVIILFYMSGISDLKKLTGTWRFVAVKRIYRVRYVVISLMFLLSLLSLLIGLSGISWQKKPKKDDSVGLEVIFLLDVSRSMLAQDIIPSRLSKSISLMTTVIDSIDDCKFGVVVFKGEAFVSVPMTEDKLALESYLSSVSPNIITSPGSNQEKALRLAMSSFSGNSSNKRVILMISDGEALEGDVFKVVGDSINEGIPIYTIAAGTEKGSNIPIGEGYVLNKQGREVITKTDYSLLENLADLTYGKFYKLEDTQVIAQVSQEIKSMEYDSVGGRIKYINVVQYRPFLLLALVFLLLYIFIKEWRWSEIF